MPTTVRTRCGRMCAMTAPWPAPRATSPVDADVSVPGSKSATNRALVLAALADGPSMLRAPLRSRDSTLMADGLRACGVSVTDVAGSDALSWTVGAGSATDVDGIPQVDC